MMYMVFIIDHIHHLMNKSKISILLIILIGGCMLLLTSAIGYMVVYTQPLKF